MKRKLQNIANKLNSIVLIVAILIGWQVICMLGIVPAFMLPSPVDVVRAFVSDFSLLMRGAWVSLGEAFIGLFFGITIGVAFAVVMDVSPFLYRSLYPVLLVTQTVPSIAIAPLLVLWMGYGMAPKIMLVFLVCFFPVTIGVLDGLREADEDAISLLRSMGAGTWQVYRHIKFPTALPRFFSGLKIAVTYSIVGAVIAEWLGGDTGLGVYMTRVRKSFAFDKMFAVIFFISLLSILLMGLIKLLEKKAMPYLRPDKQGEEKDT